MREKLLLSCTKKLLILSFIIVFFFSSEVYAADNDPNQFWVRADGNDNCTGQENLSYDNDSINCAWKTIQKAADTLSTGQKVRVQAGTYYETVKIWNDDTNDHNNTIFKGDGYPLVACTDGSTSWDGMKGFEITDFKNPPTLVQNVTITGFRVENCAMGIAFTGNYTNISYNIIGGSRNKGYSRKNIERGISAIPLFSSGVYLRWSFSNSYIGHNTINTTMYEYDGTTSSGVTSGIRFDNVLEETDVMMEYNTIDQGEWATQTTDGTGVSIAMGRMPWNYLESCYNCNEPVNHNMKIQHNIILGSGRNCIAGNSIDSLYYNNTLKRCWHNGIDLHSVWNANVSYNEIYEIVDGPSAPIYLAWGYENTSKASGGRVIIIKNITIHDNYIHDSTKAAAIKAENSYNMTVYNNIFYNVTAAVSIFGNIYGDHDAVCGQHLFYNNTINYTTTTNGYAYKMSRCQDSNSTIEDNNEIAALVSINDTFYNVTNLIQNENSNQSVYIINPRWESPTTGKSLYDDNVFRIYSNRYAERGMHLAWFADVQVRNASGNDISGANVTFAPNASYEGRNTAISLEGFIDRSGKPIINRPYNLSPKSLDYTLTGADGHIPAWPNSTWTPVIIDYVKIYNGSYPLQYLSWFVTASKNGAMKTAVIDVDSSWYRSNPDTYQNTTEIVFGIGTNPPNITFVLPTPESSTALTQDYVYINVSIDDNTGPMGSVNLEFNGKTYSMTIAAPMTSSTYAYRNMTGLTNGTYVYRVWASDMENNWNVSESRTVIINHTSPVDASLPTIEFAPPTPDTETNVNQSYVYVNATINVNATCGCSIDNVILDWNGSNTTMTEVGYGASISVYKNVTDLGKGTYTYRIYATTSSGNMNTSEMRTVTVNYIVIIDSVQPSIEFSDPTPADDTVTVNNHVYVNTSISDVSDVSSFIDWNRSLAGYWRFEEDAGSTAEDSSTYGNNGTIYGAVSSDGKFGKALNFDGNDYVEIENPDLNLTNGITIEAWVKPVPGSRGSIAARYVYNYDIPVNDRSFELSISSSGNVEFALSSNGTRAGTIWLTSNMTVNDNVWNHIVATSDGTTMRIYINGVLDPETKPAPSIVHSPDRPIQIGAWKYGIWSNEITHFFNGIIDEVKIHSRALSQQEINASYDSKLYNLEHNFTSRDNGNYSYYACAQDTAGNYNCTETRVVTVGFYSQPLFEGWNNITEFIGYNNTPVEDSLSSVDYTIIWELDDGNNTRWSHVKGVGGDFSNLTSGEAYRIYVNSNTTWTYPVP